MIQESAESDWIRSLHDDRLSRLASVFVALFATTIYILAAAHVASHFADSSGSSASQPCAVCANIEPPVSMTMIAIASDPLIMTSAGAFMSLRAFPSWHIEGASLPRAPPSPAETIAPATPIS